MITKTGSIYTINYTNWKSNPGPQQVFILHPGLQKYHCLNLSSRQLSTLNRLKLVKLISQLSKLEQSSKYNGRVLYSIFKRYAPGAVRQCYRTYWRQYINRYSLVNYGLNKKVDFTDIELKWQDKQLYQQSKRNMIVKGLNMFNKKGHIPTVSNSFAKPIHDKTLGSEAPNTIESKNTSVGGDISSIDSGLDDIGY